MPGYRRVNDSHVTSVIYVTRIVSARDSRRTISDIYKIDWRKKAKGGRGCALMGGSDQHDVTSNRAEKGCGVSPMDAEIVLTCRNLVSSCLRAGARVVAGIEGRRRNSTINR